MTRMVAFCGIECSDCPAYLATQANDLEAQEALLAQWREEYHNPGMGLAAVTCDGCSSDGRLGGYCSECGVRSCAVGRGIASCSQCSDYSCEMLDDFLENVPAARNTLEQIRLLNWWTYREI